MCATARLRIVAGMPVRPSVLDPQLRQNYITPHCIKYLASHSQARLWPCTASRPMGLSSRRYAKLPTLVRACQPPALPSRFASYVQSSVALVVCLHLGINLLLRKCFWSVACGHSSCVCPCPPFWLACFAASPRGLPVRPPRGLPQTRAKTSQLLPLVFIETVIKRHLYEPILNR